MSNLAALAAALTVAGQSPEPAPAVTAFKCEGGPSLSTQFTSRGTRFFAIVNAGNGPHALESVPFTGGPVKLTWTDGVRTLTWSPGVQIMWMDGRAHHMCGRAGGHGAHGRQAP